VYFGVRPTDLCVPPDQALCTSAILGDRLRTRPFRVPRVPRVSCEALVGRTARAADRGGSNGGDGHLDLPSSGRSSPAS